MMADVRVAGVVQGAARTAVGRVCGSARVEGPVIVDEPFHRRAEAGS